MTVYLYSLCVFVGLISGPLLAVLSEPPAHDGPVLVISLVPGLREQIIERAGGRIVGPQQAAFGSFATSNDPNFVQNLQASDVWFVVNGRRIAKLCGVET